MAPVLVRDRRGRGLSRRRGDFVDSVAASPVRLRMPLLWGRRAIAGVGVLCLVAAGGCFVEASRSTAGRHLVPFRAAAIAPVVVPGPSSPPTTSFRVPAPVAPPVRLVVPAVGMSARIVPVGLDSQGQLEVPSPSLAGRYRLGPAPGAVGPAVIVGHVDMVAGPAVFYRLTGVRAGEEVDVLRADGRRSDLSSAE